MMYSSIRCLCIHVYVHLSIYLSIYFPLHSFIHLTNKVILMMYLSLWCLCIQVYNFIYKFHQYDAYVSMSIYLSIYLPLHSFIHLTNKVILMMYLSLWCLCIQVYNFIYKFHQYDAYVSMSIYLSIYLPLPSFIHLTDKGILMMYLSI